MQQNQSYNELLIIMPENRPYRLFASFCRSFIIFEFLPFIEPAALRIPLQLTLWLLLCVAQQLASDYIWAMHQIIAQTVAWPVDFPYRCPVGNAGVKFRASVEALPISQLCHVM